MLIPHTCWLFAAVIFLIGFVHQSQQYANKIIAKISIRSPTSYTSSNEGLHAKLPISFRSTRYVLIIIILDNIILGTIRVLHDTWDHNVFALLAIASILSAILTTLFSLFQYLRLYYAFKNTAYALSRCNQGLLMILFGITIVAYVILCSLFVIFSQIDDHSKGGHGSPDPYLHYPIIQTLYFGSLITLGLTPVIISVIVMTLFCMKLWKIALIGQIHRHSKLKMPSSSKNNHDKNRLDGGSRRVTITKNSTVDNMSMRSVFKFRNSRDAKLSVTPEQQVFLNVIAKQTLLSCFQTTIFFYVFNEIIGTFDGWGVIYYILYVFMRSLWILCMWLSFVFAQKQYDFCCNRCHKCCLKCCIKLAENSIHHNMKQQSQTCQTYQSKVTELQWQKKISTNNQTLNEPLLENGQKDEQTCLV